MTENYRSNKTKAALLRGEILKVAEINRIFDPAVVEDVHLYFCHKSSSPVRSNEVAKHLGERNELFSVAVRCYARAPNR